MQLKLGPGGLRDVEFTIQLLQLVHGQTDDAIRQRGTLAALAALAEQRLHRPRARRPSSRATTASCALLEHRLQLDRLRRTHLMPRDERRAARARPGVADSRRNAADLTEPCGRRTKQRVRGLHERLFYRPLLSAVAALPDDGLALTSEQAEARLAAIGFRDPRGRARAHRRAHRRGVAGAPPSSAHLLPVLMLSGSPRAPTPTTACSRSAG